MLAVQLSWRMWGFCATSSGRASRQYFVQAQSEPRRLRAARVIVMEGWRETMRMDSEYRILRDVEYPPTPSICVKVF